MSKFELTWKDFQQKGNEKRTTFVEVFSIIFFSYFLLSLVSFWQYIHGEVPYSSFWHAPWISLIDLFL